MIFISYSRKNETAVNKIRRAITSRTKVDCWIDRSGIPCGEHVAGVISKAIDDSSAVLFMMSEESLQSEYVYLEIQYALKVKKRIIPVIIEDCVQKGPIVFELGNANYIDFRDPIQRRKLMDDLVLADRPPVSKKPEEPPVTPAPKDLPLTHYSRMMLIGAMALMCLFLAVCYWCGWAMSEDSWMYRHGYAHLWKCKTDICLFRGFVIPFVLTLLSAAMIYWRRIKWPLLLMLPAVGLVVKNIYCHWDEIGYTTAHSYIKYEIGVSLILAYVLLIAVMFVAVYAPANHVAFASKTNKWW